MLSSSTYLSYINQLNTNKSIYLNLRTKVKNALFCMTTHTNNLNNAKSHFESGYQEENGSTLTGDLIINVCNSSRTIAKKLEDLSLNINNEITKINGKINEYTSFYHQALNAERERERRQREAKAKLGIIS